jgi:hypothetical protein
MFKEPKSNHRYNDTPRDKPQAERVEHANLERPGAPEGRRMEHPGRCRPVATALTTKR